MQSLMALTLLTAVNVDFVTKLTWFTAIIFVHNAAEQRRWMSRSTRWRSPSCRSMSKASRAGLMFAGGTSGRRLAAGVLLLTPYVQFNAAFVLVAAAILAVTFGVSIRLREQPAESASRVRRF